MPLNQSKPAVLALAFAHLNLARESLLTISIAQCCKHNNYFYINGSPSAVPATPAIWPA